MPDFARELESKLSNIRFFRNAMFRKKVFLKTAHPFEVKAHQKRNEITSKLSRMSAENNLCCRIQVPLRSLLKNMVKDC